MTQEEMRSRIVERIKVIERRLSDTYPRKDVNGRVCFIRGDGTLFRVNHLLSFGAIVIEYAENEAEAYLNRFEDGDLFFLEEMDEATMLERIFWEIRQ